MPGISIHVVDVSRGVVATGMQVEVLAVTNAGPADVIAAGQISKTGILDVPALAHKLAAGVYEAIFHIEQYYRDAGIALPPVPFLDVVTYRFGLSDPEAHYHLPMKCTPWGYSCFRGGA